MNPENPRFFQDFSAPPYYYKEFQQPDSKPIPDLKQIVKHVDDYYCLAQFHNFKDYIDNPNPAKKIVEELIQLGVDINKPLKQNLKDVNTEIMECILKISTAIGQGSSDRREVERLQKLTDIFNKLCQYLKLRETYIEVMQIYQHEIRELITNSENLSQQSTKTKEDLKKLREDIQF